MNITPLFIFNTLELDFHKYGWDIRNVLIHDLGIPQYPSHILIFLESFILWGRLLCKFWISRQSTGKFHISSGCNCNCYIEGLVISHTDILIRWFLRKVIWRVENLGIFLKHEIGRIPLFAFHFPFIKMIDHVSRLL